jgi:hypothetical protein
MPEAPFFESVMSEDRDALAWAEGADRGSARRSGAPPERGRRAACRRRAARVAVERLRAAEPRGGVRLDLDWLRRPGPEGRGESPPAAMPAPQRALILPLRFFLQIPPFEAAFGPGC